MRRDIVERLTEDRYRFLPGLGLHLVERAIDDRFGNRFLAIEHDGIHELGDHQIAEFRIRVDFALFCTVTSGHGSRLSTFEARRRTKKRRSRETLTSDAWRRISNGAACGFSHPAYRARRE